MPIWGIINTIDHGSIGPLRREVDDARKAVDGARKTLLVTQNALQQLQSTRQALTTQKQTQALAAAELPALAALADAAIQRIDTMEAGFVAAEKATTEAVRRAAGLSNAALATADLAISKKDFSGGILDVLEVLVMDSKTAAGAKPILDSLTAEYGSPGMPKELQDRCAGIEDKLAQLLKQS
jgi:hypothetical protein